MPIKPPPRLYLAGPGVFRTDARKHGARLKALCAHAGCDGFFPLDNEICETHPLAQARAIHAANVAMIDTCDALIADISPFRGPNMDPGTAWEIGYAAARRLPVFLYTSDTRTLLARTHASHRLMRHGSGVDDERFVDDNQMSVENFGLVENLMIAALAARVHATAEDAIAACANHLSPR